MAIPASPETERRILLYRLMLINLNMYTAICLSWVSQAHRFRSSAEAGVFAGVAAEHGAPDQSVLLVSTGGDQGSSRRLRSVTAVPHRSHAGQILMIVGHHGGSDHGRSSMMRS